MRLVLVHGRKQEGKDPSGLQEEWTDALKYGFARANAKWPDTIDVSFAYYGDELIRLVEKVEAEAKLPSELGQRGPGDIQDVAATEREILEELAATAGITEGQIADEFPATQPRDPQNWGVVLAVTRALAKIPGLDASLIDRWVRDVSVYLNYPHIRSHINGIVDEAIGDDPFVLVSHSLGTVVAYETLQSRASTPECAGLISLGSPLGITGIKKRIKSPVSVPLCVVDWFNAFDRSDVIALVPLDQKNFDVRPPIENYGDVKNFTDNRHGITGYLADPVVAKRIADRL